MRVVSRTGKQLQRVRGRPPGLGRGSERGDHHVGVEPAGVSLGPTSAAPASWAKIPTSAAPASWAKMMQVERSVKSALRRHLLRIGHPHDPGRIGPDPDVRQRGADASARLQGVGAGRGDAEPMRD